MPQHVAAGEVVAAAKAVLAPKPWASARAQVPGASVEQSQRHPMQCHYMIPSLPAGSIPIHAAEKIDPSDQATFPRHLTLEVFLSGPGRIISRRVRDGRIERRQALARELKAQMIRVEGVNTIKD
jgi:hypothetical protein